MLCPYVKTDTHGTQNKNVLKDRETITVSLLFIEKAFNGYSAECKIHAIWEYSRQMHSLTRSVSQLVSWLILGLGTFATKYPATVTG